MTSSIPCLRANGSTIRELERASIADVIARAAELGIFAGRLVLDYGCGRQPYRDLIEGAGGDYIGWNRARFPGLPPADRVDVGEIDDPLAHTWDVIVCTQVVQYVPHVERLLCDFWRALQLRAGMLVLTYPTCWDEVEPEDLHRFTRAGVDRLLVGNGFETLEHERRAEVELGGFRFPLGGGVIARARR